METFYASITNNLVFKRIKYKIGKRYPLINGKEKFYKWNDIDINNIYGKLSIYLVKMDKTNNYFKILKEINYSEFLKSKDKKENLISALKNRDKWSLSKFSDTSDMSQQVNVYIKNENYLDILVKSNQLKYLPKFAIKYLHNKYLDILIDNDDNSCDNENVISIANLGIPKYLDKISQKEKFDNYYEIRAVLLNGRNKDIKKFINNKEYAEIISKTGIDKYLDKLIISKNIYILSEIAGIGRKKDLDMLVKSPYETIQSIVAYHGYDEHLDVLVHDKSTMVLQSVLDVGREKDVNFIKSLPIAKKLKFKK